MSRLSKAKCDVCDKTIYGDEYGAHGHECLPQNYIGLDFYKALKSIDDDIAVKMLNEIFAKIVSRGIEND